MGRPKPRKHLEIDDSFWTWLDSPESPMHIAASAIFAADDVEPADVVAQRIATTFRDRTDVEPRFRTLIRTRRFPGKPA